MSFDRLLAHPTRPIRLVCFCLVAACCWAPSAWADEVEDPLWDRAVELVSKGSRYFPGKWVESWEFFAAEGDSICRREVVRTNPRVENSALRWDRIETEDFYDKKDKENENASCKLRGPDKWAEFTPLYGTFLLDGSQRKVKYEPTDVVSVVNGQTCREFRIWWKPRAAGKGPFRPFVGTACLEQESGLPLEIRLSFEKLPKDLESWQMIRRYSIGRSGLALVDTLEVRIDPKGHEPWIWHHKLSEYRRTRS